MQLPEQANHARAPSHQRRLLTVLTVLVVFLRLAPVPLLLLHICTLRVVAHLLVCSSVAEPRQREAVSAHDVGKPRGLQTSGKPPATTHAPMPRTHKNFHALHVKEGL